MVQWKPSELKRLRGLYEKKQPWETDYQFAIRNTKVFDKSSESIRWQVRQFHQEIELSFPKILLLDIETLPIKASVWGTRKQFVNPIQIEKDWSVVCWSAKWLFSDKVFGEVVTPKEAIAHEDQSVLGGIWSLVNDAHVVITHNGNAFDMKKLNWRFFVHDMPKPMYYKSIDTYQVVTDNFAPTFGKLDWIAEVLGISRKIETSFKWWDECQKGNKTYLNRMLVYNKQDVHILEEAYLKLRPWVTNHPNINLYSSVKKGNACPACSSTELKFDGEYNTGLSLFRGFRCQKCGSIGRISGKEFKLSSTKVKG